MDGGFSATRRGTGGARRPARRHRRHVDVHRRSGARHHPAWRRACGVAWRSRQHEAPLYAGTDPDGSRARATVDNAAAADRVDAGGTSPSPQAGGCGGNDVRARALTGVDRDGRASLRPTVDGSAHALAQQPARPRPAGVPRAEPDQFVAWLGRVRLAVVDAWRLHRKRRVDSMDGDVCHRGRDSLCGVASAEVLDLVHRRRRAAGDGTVRYGGRLADLRADTMGRASILSGHRRGANADAILDPRHARRGRDADLRRSRAARSYQTSVASRRHGGFVPVD